MIAFQYITGKPFKYNWSDALMYIKSKDTTYEPLESYQKHRKTWEYLVNIIKKPEISIDKSCCSMFNLTEFKIDNTSKKRESDKKISRCIDNAIRIYGIILDYDEGAKYSETKKLLKNLKYLAYSSFNHNWNKRTECIDKNIEKFRIVLPLKQPVTPYEFQQRKYSLQERFPGVDKSTFNISRVFFVYSVHPERKELGFFDEQDGEFFDLLKLEEFEDYYEYDEDDIVEITDENKLQILESLKTIKNDSLHHMEAFKIITFCKNLKIPLSNFEEILNEKISRISTLSQRPDELKRLYQMARGDAANIGVFFKIIKDFGGDTNVLKIKIPKGIQKLVDIEPCENNRFNIFETEDDIKKGIKEFFHNKKNVLLAHEPGSGKTKITMDIIASAHKEAKKTKSLFGNDIKIFIDANKTKIDWFAFNKSNIDDVFNYLKNKNINVRKVLGRDNFCEHEFFKIKQDKDHPDYEILKDIKEADFCTQDCPFATRCEYPKQFTKDAAVSIKHHSFLFNKESYWDQSSGREATHIIIDESVLGDGFKIWIKEIKDLPPISKRILSAFSEKSKNTNIIVELNNYLNLISKIFEVEEDDPPIVHSDIFHPNVYIRNKPSIYQRLEFEVEELNKLNKIYYSELYKCGLNIYSLRKFYESDIGKPFSYSLTKQLVFILNELNNNRDNFTFAVWKDWLIVREIQEYRGKWTKQPKLLLDATPCVELLPFNFKVYDKLTEWSPSLFVEQIYDKSFSKSMIEKEGEPLFQDIVKWLLKLCNRNKVGIITYKYLEKKLRECILLKEHINNKTLLLGHYGDNKGTNIFEERDILIILGQYRENPISLYHKARIKYGKELMFDKETFRKGIYKMRNGPWKEQKKGYRIYSDSKIQLLADISETNEMIQSIGRIRPTRVALPKRTYIITNRPLDIPINKLSLWRNILNEEEKQERISKEEGIVFEYIKLIMSDGKERSRDQIIKEIMEYAECKLSLAKKIYSNLKERILNICNIRVGIANSHHFKLK